MISRPLETHWLAARVFREIEPSPEKDREHGKPACNGKDRTANELDGEEDEESRIFVSRCLSEK